MAVYLAGAVLFLYPVQLSGGRALGLLVAVIGLCSNAGAALLGRAANRDGLLSPLVVTMVSMGIGAITLLVTGIAVEGIPTPSGHSWLIIAALALVNTAFAFTLWNHTLRRLTAVRSSVINNTMLIQIAVLAWIFLDEPLGARQIVGLLLAAVGSAAVQLLRAREPGQG